MDVVLKSLNVVENIVVLKIRNAALMAPDVLKKDIIAVATVWLARKGTHVVGKSAVWMDINVAVLNVARPIQVVVETPVVTCK
jgi:hypothetical protein